MKQPPGCVAVGYIQFLNSPQQTETIAKSLVVHATILNMISADDFAV